MGDPAGPRRAESAPPRPQVSIEVTAPPVLSSALAHNRVPVVSRLALTAVGGSVREATVRLSVRDADGPLGKPAELLVDLDEGRTAVLTDVGLALDPAAMLRVDQQRPGVLDVELLVDGTVLASRRTDVQVLAAAQWLARPVSLALEMLAAHVLPHHPAAAELVDDAIQLLQDGTGSPAAGAAHLGGYLGGAQRVDAFVAALAEALRRRGVQHSEPPASWADLGQQVRTPGEVLTWRVATPLDVVVLLAAALEHAGLRPLLWLVDGDGPRGAHAFLGYWREARAAESAASTDVTDLVGLLDLGLIGLVEPTLLTGGASPVEDLHGPAHARCRPGELDRILGVTDVARARRDGILPLPARARDAEGVLRVTEYSPASATVVPRAADVPVAGGRTDAPPRVQQWKTALLDLSLRNRLINYTARSGLSLAVSTEALGILENFVRDGTPLTVLPEDVHGDEQPGNRLVERLVEHRAVHADVTDEAYLGRLRSLAYKAKTVTEETGANNLYLALGTVAWELDGRPLRSPLLLFPVVLEPSSREGRYRLTVDETVAGTRNYCLLEKLRQVHGLAVPALAESPADGSAPTVEAALAAVRAALAAAGLPYQVEATAELALLQFARFRLWQDLDEHWATFAENPLVAHLVQPPAEAFADPVPDTAANTDLDELAAQCAVPADASQLRAVAEAVAGRTFVLEGPPGTGKSQVITNLLSRAVADGKRVLFVAEKRAALDVVARRLAAVGMAPFALDLHDRSCRATTVRAQIRAALEHTVEVDEGTLAADRDELRSARRTLARYPDRLHAPNAAGLSLYSGRTAQLAAGPDVPTLPVPEAFVALAAAETTTAVRRALALLPEIADLTRPSPRHAWAFVNTPQVDPAQVQDAARAVDAAVRALPTAGPLADVLRWTRTPDELDALAALLDGPPVGLDVLDDTATELWTAATSAVLGEVAAFLAFRHPGLDVLVPEVLALPLGELYVRAQTTAASGWLGRRGRLAEVQGELTPYLRPGAAIQPQDVPAVVEALWRVQNGVQAMTARAASIPGIALPEGWNPFLEPGLLDRQVQWLRRAGAAIDGSSPFHVALRRLLVAGVAAGAGTPPAGAPVARLADGVRDLLAACSSTPARLAQWTGSDGFVLRWTMTRPERGLEHPRLNSLRRWASFLDTLEPLRTAGLHEARALLLAAAVPADDAVRAYDRGLAEASLRERADATGLDAFDVRAHEQAIARFTAASRTLRAHLVTALPAGVLTRRAATDDQQTAARMAELRGELARQRRGLGVRELLTRYGDLITAALPCVLVSPDSVARFFPAVAGQFDFVVFDEASQIRVAEAVGALGRARSAVVVGDSRQLPPSSVAEPSSTADDGPDTADVPDAVAEDDESILSECVQAGVPRRWLSWHYRSQDESLIAFSNAHYYGNRLSSFPAPTHGRPSAEPQGRGVSLVRVDGSFVRSGPARLQRTNPVEAEAVVAEIRRRFALSPAEPPSIGVVTFNAQQRSLIEGLLRDAGDDQLVEALDRTDGEGLFVKNLENVQGDERDAVLFSTGFSPAADGVLPLNFGPLNRTGGERRLNVAVTRARRQVVVFSSFDPAQLRAEETSSVGIKHLRAYLDLAVLGTDALPRPPRSAAVPDRHREEIAAALRARDLVVRTDVGLSGFKVDLSVARSTDPESPVMAVLLDGPEWARRRTVGDRDGLPVEVLGGLLRWPVVERLWLPSWLSDAEAEVDRLEAAVERVPLPVPARLRSALAGVARTAPASAPASALTPAPAPVPAPRVPSEPTSTVPGAGTGVAALRSGVPAPVEAQVPPAAASAPAPAGRRAAATVRTTLEGEVPFLAWTPRTAGEKSVLDALPDDKAAHLVRRVLTAGVKAEGPVHVDRLTRLAAGAFGLGRVSEARKAALLSLLPPSAVVDDYLWPDDVDPARWTGFRRQTSSVDRPLEHVCPEEICNAMVALCAAAADDLGAGLAREELLTRTAVVFGYRRRTATTTPILQAALAWALECGWLIERDGALLAA